MTSSELIFAVFFFLQCAIGFIGNSLLLIFFVFIIFKKPQQKKFMDLILIHLTLTNMITLFTRGIPEIMFCFGMRNFLDDLCCKILMYIYRIARGLSVCTTSLLSMLQAIIISPNNSMWAWMKGRFHRYILHCFFFFWVINGLIYIRVIEVTEATKNITISSYRYASHIYMSQSKNGQKLIPAFLLSMTLHDFIFHFLMILSSTHMVLLLYRHSKQVQHIYSSSHCSRSFPEVKATQTILLLVSCFVLFYWLHNCVILYVHMVSQNDIEWDTIGAFFGGWYPALSPVFLLSSDSRIPKLHVIFWKGRKPKKNIVAVLFNS